MTFDTKTWFYIRLTHKEWVSNWEECNQKDGRLYFIVLKAIDNHSPITIGDILLQNNCERIFWLWFLIQKHNSTSDLQTKSGVQVGRNVARSMIDPILLFSRQ